MTYKLACGDVLPGCDARIETASRDELMEQVAAHVASAHGITDITPEILTSVESKITVS